MASRLRKGIRFMQKVIFVTISMRGGGTERVISILANRMVKMGYEVTIMMIAESGIEYELDSRIRCVCVSEATNGSLLGRLERIRNMRKEIKQDCGAYVFGMGTVASMFTVMAAFGLKWWYRNEMIRMYLTEDRFGEWKKCFEMYYIPVQNM